jgi:hypothetical protein
MRTTEIGYGWFMQQLRPLYDGYRSGIIHPLRGLPEEDAPASYLPSLLCDFDLQSLRTDTQPGLALKTTRHFFEGKGFSNRLGSGGELCPPVEESAYLDERVERR